MKHPLVHIGWDLGVKRDTCAVIGVYRDTIANKYAVWGHHCFDPKSTGQVDVEMVSALIERIMQHERVGGVWYDPWQLYSEAQRLSKKGYAHLLHEVNQQTESVVFSNNLSSAIETEGMLYYSNPTVRSHLSWCGAEVTERGYRIKKRDQNKPVDLTVATAMALYGCMQDHSHTRFTSMYEDTTHEATALP